MELTTALYISVAVSFVLAILVVVLVARLSSDSKHSSVEVESDDYED